ncbi:Cyclin-D4-1 like [Heracleum sosnowskyi]|uniref:Cyclin-D4-1 like n=1 Tax=Heracleum sosnowskyi TaxID=360622 RepID=A0AAD8MFA2_9APIA|nr:Cyclin-D4-1 like [Heracleum sosnowskyi]KAK1371311.1 Cyclin-D4-1 like [Heracleum sosnowskyi]KAK1371315.1 Cyclin-D4-1 like [Heracleum sosnowskyi]
MARSLDCDVSSLLCAEENESIYFDDDVVEEYQSTNVYDMGSDQNRNFKVEEGLMSGSLPLQSDECVDSMFAKECEYLPALDYLERLRNADLDLKARQEAVDWIGKALSHFNFGPLCAYLSVNYLDRFLSAYKLPPGEEWMMQLLAIACLSLAAKMEETEVPLCLNLQVGESKFLFEAKTIQRMELLVLSTLKWRMQSITPFSFIDRFLTNTMGDHLASRLPIFRSTQLILSMINGIDLLEFRPSEIAAAAALSVAGENQTVDTKKALYQLDHRLGKERVAMCVELMKKSSSLSSLSAISSNRSNELIQSSLPQSPIGVIDAACISYKSDETTVGSCVNSLHYSENTKRRKLN